MKKYLVFIQRKPEFSGNAIPKHREFLQSLREKQLLDYADGFADQSGGAYIVTANSLEAAEDIVKTDPMFIENDCHYMIKEWNI